MKTIPFYKFSPAGNDTLFLVGLARRDISATCGAALSIVSAEQAAAIDLAARSVEMAGGEFCVNACRAFAALLDYSGATPDDELDGAKRYSASISGYEGKLALAVRGSAPRWRASVAFRPRNRINRADEGCLADLPGISHFLIKSREFPSRGDARAAADALARELDLASRPAWGTVWWRESEGICEIMPYVVCPGAGTEIFETSCGSASVALALALNREKASIRQPSGEILDIAVSSDGIVEADGPVELKVEGLLRI